MHMSHDTSGRNDDDLGRSTRLAEYEREAMTRLYAYYRAERRSFAPGHEMDDWLTAERELLNRESGGVPIKVNGEVVGAIGVSGAPKVQNDVDCARAALALVPDATPTKK
jgi:hypothetical protein